MKKTFLSLFSIVVLLAGCIKTETQLQENKEEYEKISIEIDKILSDLSKPDSYYCEKDSDCEKKFISRSCCAMGFISCANKNANFDNDNLRMLEKCKEYNEIKKTIYPLSSEVTCDPVEFKSCKCDKGKCEPWP